MLFLWVRLFNLYDFCRNVLFYYVPNPKFALVDTYLMLSYFFKSPYRIARNAYPKSGPYGETPFAVMDALLKHISLKPQARVLDIGCGRGRLAFWLHMVRGFSVTGIDVNRTFIHRAQNIEKFWNLDVKFKEKSCFALKQFDVDLIYFFVLHFSDDELHQFAKHVAASHTNAYIVTISFWLGEYLPHRFELVDTCKLHFVWGETIGYIQKVRQKVVN